MCVANTYMCNIQVTCALRVRLTSSNYNAMSRRRTLAPKVRTFGYSPVTDIQLRWSVHDEWRYIAPPLLFGGITILPRRLVNAAGRAAAHTVTARGGWFRLRRGQCRTCVGGRARDSGVAANSGACAVHTVRAAV